MKIVNNIFTFGKLALFLLSFVIVSTLNSCSKKVTFLTSTMVPAARGTIDVKTDKNKNYAVNVQITDLAEVSRLSPAKQTYIVWMITDQNLTKNLGQLISAEKGMAKRLTATLKTVTSFKPTKIFVTAENEPSTQYPSEQIVISTDFFVK